MHTGLNKPLILTLAVLMGASAFAVDGSLSAIPSVANAFAVDTGMAQLTVSLYLLGFGIAQIPMGFMADYFGRRRLLLIGMSLFVVFGLLSSISASIEILLGARFLQGICAASAAVIARAVARDITEGQDTLRLMGLLTSTMGVAMILAPLIGGLAMEGFGWRASFGTSALFGGIGLLLALAFLPETNRSERQASVLQTFIHSAKAFVKSPASLFGAVLVGFSFGALMTYVTTSSDLLMAHYGITPIIYAASFSIAAVGYMAGGLVSRYLARRYSPNQLIRYTAVVYLICAAIFTGFIFAVPAPLWLLLSVVFVYFACISAMLSLATAYTLSPLPKSAGMAAAILGCFQLLAGAGVSLVLATFNVDGLQDMLGVMLGFAGAIGIWVFLVGAVFFSQRS